MSREMNGTLTVVSLLMLAGCGGEPAGPGETGEPTQLVFDMDPGDGVAGAPLAAAVAIADVDGDVLPSVTGTITLELGANPAGGALLGTLSAPVVNGVATFDDLGIERAGAGYTLVARSGTLTAATSAPFTIMPGTPTRLAFQMPPSDVDLDVAFAPALEVAVEDAFGNVVPTAAAAVTMALDANPGSATLDGTVAVAVADGVATFTDLRLNRAAAGYTLTAASAGLASVTSEPFEVVFAFVQLSAARDAIGLQDHTCGVTSAGAAYCWGANFYGQLGDGNAGSDSDTPVRVQGGYAFASVAAGGAHTCGVTKERVAYCWGLNNAGQLGDGGPPAGSDTPVLVAGGRTLTMLATGLAHTCGIASDGSAVCWGENTDGQLGDGNLGADSDVPVTVRGGDTFTSLTAGAAHMCGLTTGGAARCWGLNNAGQLGDGKAGVDRDTAETVLGGRRFVSLAAGTHHTCGATTNGDGFCWGDNSYGQLGDGDAGADADAPVLVLGGHALVGVTAGSVHTCGLTTAGDAVCWGDDVAGALGDGNEGSFRDTPLRVLGGLTFASLAAGGFHTCALTTERATYCWGWNAFGQLGDGNLGVDRSAPVPVSDP